MNQRVTLTTGMVLAGLGVAIGAFGAHSLKDILIQNGRVDTFELAVRYQFYHAFALLIGGILMNQSESSRLRYASWCFTFGVIFFSGSLYILSITGATALGAVTPIGGALFIFGWILLLLALNEKKKGR